MTCRRGAHLHVNCLEPEIYLVGHLIDWVGVLRPTWHRIGHFGDVFRSQSLSLVLKKLNTTKASNTGIKWSKLTQKTHIMLNLNKHTKMKSKPKPTSTFKNCSYVYACHCASLSYTIQHRTVLIIFWLTVELTTCCKSNDRHLALPLHPSVCSSSVKKNQCSSFLDFEWFSCSCYWR